MSDKPHSVPRPDGIRDQILDEELKSSYLTYAMSVIISRALPDVRDGLKPSQRRVLVSMNDLNLGPRAKFRKCSKITGDTTANYHPHGDQVVYPTLVRLAQDFNMGYPLVDKQGNFGAIDGSPAAAQRYTEARMSEAAVDLLDDLDKETVDFIRNYDDTRDEPTVLPGRFPNLLCNGSQGIAVGMATSVPPHNLREIADAAIALIANPDIDIAGLMEFVKGPDFPTGGIICGRSGILQAYMTGRGHLTVRAKAVIEPMGKDREQIVVTELPYQVNPISIFEKCKILIAEKIVEGISNINDETDREDGLRLVFEIKKGFQADVVLNQLFRHTQLQDTFSINLLALSKGRPVTFDLKGLLHCYVEHRIDVIRRRTRYLKRKAEDRLHIVLGLLIAIASIEEVIKVIRESTDTPSAKANLMSTFLLSDRQATAILDMRLARLTALEAHKLEDERLELESQIRRYNEILGDIREVHKLIVADLEALKERYTDPRRTEIADAEGEIEDERLIPDDPMLVTVSHSGYIKRISPQEFRQQGRGGKGITGADTKDGDFIERLISANNHDTFLVFTTRGQVFWLKVYTIPLLGRTSAGRFIENLIEFKELASEGGKKQKEKVASILPISKGGFETERYLVTVTRQGIVKKTPLADYGRPKKGGIIGAGLKDDDVLIRALITSGKDHILISTAKGQTIRFDEEEVRPMGRTASGVIGISFKYEGDEVVDADVADDTATLLTVCASGYGKRSPCAEYPQKGRGTQGTQNISADGIDRNGNVVAARVCRGEEDLIMISVNGMTVRTTTSSVREIGRGGMGVRVMSLADDDRIGAAVLVDRAPDEPVAAEAIPSESAPPSDAAPGEPTPDMPDVT